MYPRYVLDTNIIVHAVRRDTVWHRIQAKYNLLLLTPTPAISIVTLGEIRSLARLLKWGAAKQAQMNFLLGTFDRIPVVAEELVENYARIDVYSRARGRRMGKNDLWIAATAAFMNATLLTCDADFDHLNPHLINVIRISPAR